jgi:uncharacterized protein
VLKPWGNGWFRLDSDGTALFFDSLGLSIVCHPAGTGAPVPGALPRSPAPVPPPPAPGTVQAVVTTGCNLACRYCSVAGNPCTRGGSGEMGRETADAVIEAARGCRLFAVTGGEPLLAPGVTFRLLEAAASPSVLFTNGTLLDSAVCTRLKACGTSLLVSLDGAADRHDRMRPLAGGGGSWALTAAGLDAAAEEGLDFGISIVLREHNSEGLGDTLGFLHERFGPASFGINLLHFTGRGFDGPAPGVYARAVLDAYRFARRTGTYVDQVARRLAPVVTGTPRFRDCEAMGGKTVFFPDGSRSRCVNWLGREDPPPEWAWRIPLLAAECAGCPAVCVCGGGCAWDGENMAGPGSMDSRNCVWTLALLEEILADIASAFPEGTPPPAGLARVFSPLLPDRSRVLSTSMGHTE